MADRKLIAKNERIQNLETLLGDAQEKLLHQNQKFEAQLQAVRERLGQARIQKSNQPALQLLNISRIAKPLRGGGIVIENSNVNNNNDTEKHNNMKHNSWMSNFIGAPLA